MGEATAIILGNVGASLAALSALSTAAFGIVDSSKAFWGGVSNVGLGHLRVALTPFAPALAAAVGPQWMSVVRANWINGLAKSEQKAVVGALLKLGLSEATSEAMALGGHVAPAALRDAAAKIASGTALSDVDLNVMGRMVASVEAQLDAAFERAEQQYLNVSRLVAGLIAIGLSVVAQIIWHGVEPQAAPSLLMAVAVGFLAVPIAPVAKDLTSALSAAMRALKAARSI